MYTYDPESIDDATYELYKETTKTEFEIMPPEFYLAEISAHDILPIKSREQEGFPDDRQLKLTFKILAPDQYKNRLQWRYMQLWNTRPKQPDKEYSTKQIAEFTMKDLSKTIGVKSTDFRDWYHHELIVKLKIEENEYRGEKRKKNDISWWEEATKENMQKRGLLGDIVTFKDHKNCAPKESSYLNDVPF